MKSQKNVDVRYDSRRTSKEESNNGENFDSSCSVIKVEESANSANTLNIESIRKKENSAKSSFVIPRQLSVN